MKKDNRISFAAPGQKKDGKGTDGYAQQEDGQTEGTYKQLLGDQPITWLWLLQHYSKENAAAYKAQKERAKAKKVASTMTAEDHETEKKAVPKSEQREQQERTDPERVQKEREKERENFGGTVFVERRRKQERGSVSKAALECVGFGRTVEIKRFPFRIGRSPDDVDLCIADNMAVSSVHAEINFKSNTFYITDLNSLNHVFINDMEIPQGREVALNDNAAIVLGDEKFVFHVTGN